MNLFVLLILLLLTNFSAQAKPVELVLWHSLAGQLGDEVNLLATDFNKSQQDYTIKPVYKGNYVETLTSFAAAFRAHKPPALVQVFEVGTAMMLSPQGVIKPIESLMREQAGALPQEDFIQTVREFYSRDGQLMAMPFNLSAPILYYNKDVLAKLGYSQETFPSTWAEMEVLAKQLKNAGYNCTYTTAYPGWVLFESFLSIHGLAATKLQSMASVFETPALAQHFQRMKRWYDARYFRYGGRDDDSTILFTSGVCPLFSQSSGAYNSLAAIVPFHLGVAVLPLDTQISQSRHANIAGGGALWAVSGQSKVQYKGIAQFLSFLAQPEIQKRWHEHTGYLPIGMKGSYAYILHSSHHPILKLAKTDLEDHFPLKAMKHIGPQNQIRGINDEVLESLFAGLLSPKEALKEAQIRSKHVLLRFARNTHTI